MFCGRITKENKMKKLTKTTLLKIFRDHLFAMDEDDTLSIPEDELTEVIDKILKAQE